MKAPTDESSAGMKSVALARAAIEQALSKKALDVMLLDLSQLSSVCDYFVICHGESEAQVRAIVDAIDVGLKESGARPWHIEGRDARHWVLIDYVDVVVHVFLADVRAYYRLEDLWGDAPRETFDADVAADDIGDDVADDVGNDARENAES